MTELERELDRRADIIIRQGKRITEFEKENAELKKKCYKKAVKDYCKVETQLTKAKELLKQFLSYEQIPRDCLRERYRKLLEEAEQFISEVEK